MPAQHLGGRTTGEDAGSPAAGMVLGDDPHTQHWGGRRVLVCPLPKGDT